METGQLHRSWPVFFWRARGRKWAADHVHVPAARCSPSGRVTPSNAQPESGWLHVMLTSGAQLRHRVARAGFAALAIGLLAMTSVSAASATASQVQAKSATAKHTPVYTFGVEPATKKGVDKRPYYSYVTGAGAQFNDYVAVVNYSKVPLTLTVYATDALNTPQGGYSLLTAGQKPVDVGAWTVIHDLGPDSTVRVPARHKHGPGTTILPITITVPQNASPGDHSGGIVASLRAVGTSKNQKQIINLNQRVGTREFIRVGGTLRPTLTISNLAATYHGSINPLATGTITVKYDVKNTGNLKLGGRPSVSASSLFGNDGKSAVSPQIPLLLPGSSVTETTTLTHVRPEGLLHVKVQIVPLIVQGDSDPHLGVYTASATVVAIPWLLIILAIAIAVLAYLWWRRRRTPPSQGRRRASSGGGVDGAPSGDGAVAPSARSSDAQPEGVAR
jgi:hypothetical protein